MFKIIDKEIHITCGDTATLTLNGKGDTKFMNNDVLNLYVMRPGQFTRATLLSTITVETELEEGIESADILINGEDLKDLVGYIEKPQTYYYEIELISSDRTTTLIGYDDEGTKKFIVYPEAVY